MDNFLKSALIIQALAIVTIFFDIPIARLVFGFIYVSFLPGLLIVRILKLNLKSMVETLVLAVGLSIAFSMFLGLALNELLPLMGFSQPLSLLPLLVVLGAVLLLITFIARDSPGFKYTVSLPNFWQLSLFGLLAAILALSIYGAAYHNSLALILMATLIVVVAGVALSFRKSLPSLVLPAILVIVAVSLIFQREFITQNLLGFDTFGEFYVFSSANTHSLWNPFLSLTQSELSDYNSMLSVTILPTMYSKLLNLNGEWIFKILYFLLYAFVPLTMYQMYKQNFGIATGFLGAFYFMIFPRFFGEERRQIVGELFLVLIIFTILTYSLSSKKKELLIGIFGAALVVSHYSTFYVFMFCAVVAWVAIFLLEKFKLTKPLEIKKALTARVLLLLFAFGAFWYTFVSTSLYQTFITFITNLSTTFSSGFSDIASRGGTVSEFIAPSFSTMTLTYATDYFISKIPYLLIGIGFILLVLNYKKLNIQLEYVLMAFAALSILVLTFVVPSLAESFVEFRFFHLALILLAPLCFYGGITALTWISKHFMNPAKARSSAIAVLCILFALIFLVKVGYFYEVTDDLSPGASISFSYNQMTSSTDPIVLQTLYGAYVPDCDVYSANWLATCVTNKTSLYADVDARQHVLRGYALTVVDMNNILCNDTNVPPDAYVYLRTMNIQGYLVDPYEGLVNMTYVSSELQDKNRIYSNGNSEIYFNP